MQAFGDLVQVVHLQVFARENNAPGGLVIHDDPAIAIQNFSTRGDDGKYFDTIAFRAFAVDFRAANLELPEAGNEKEKNGDGGVLEAGHLGGGEARFVARDQAARQGLGLVGMEFRGILMHGWFGADFRLAESRQGRSFHAEGAEGAEGAEKSFKMWLARKAWRRHLFFALRSEDGNEDGRVC
jgi:hypothetical protein